MMKKTGIFAHVLIVGVAFLLSACGERNPYTDALPGDVAAVVSLDLAGMVRKCDLTERTRLSVGQIVKSGLNGKADNLIDKLIEDPEQSGLRLTDRIYLFSVAQMEIGGMLARVADKSKLESLMQWLHSRQACEAAADGEGCRWTVGGGLLMAWTDDAFLVLGAAGNPRDLQHQASIWLRQKKGEGYAGTPEFGKLQGTDADVAALASLNLIPKSYMAPLTMGLPADLDLNGLKLFSTLDFRKGKVVMEVETLAESREFKDLLKKQDAVSGRLEGTYLETFPANTVCWLAANVNGEKAYELLRENPTVRRTLDNSMIPVDFEAVFKAVRGDVALAVPEMAWRPGFILCADVTGAGFLRTVEDLKPLLAMTNGQMRLLDRGKDAYQFVAADGTALGLGSGPVSVWLGVKDGRFYLTNREELIGREVKGLSLKDCEWARDVKGKRFYLNVNLQALIAAFPRMPYVDLLDYLTVESDKTDKGRMVLQMKNRQDNTLKQLLEVISH